MREMLASRGHPAHRHRHRPHAGCKKTTTLLLNFFKTDEGASRWFLKPGAKAQVAPLPK